MAADVETRLRALEDRAAIKDVLHRYCRALDRLDEALLESVFFDDAHLDYGPGLYQGPPGPFVPFALEFQGAMRQTRHMVDNVFIELDGSRAFCESYVTALHELERDGGTYDLRVDGRFIDELECREGEWRISRRLELIDMALERPASPEWFEQGPPLNRGRHDTSDPVYTLYANWKR